MIPLACRSPSTNRATGTILLPCRVKNVSSRAIRCGGISTYRPNRATSRRPPWRPMNQPNPYRSRYGAMVASRPGSAGAVIPPPGSRGKG